MTDRCNAYYWSPVGWQAVYESGKTLPVEQWRDSDGEPMVVDHTRNKLISAGDLSGFQRLSKAPSVIGVTPAAPGWFIKLEDDENPEDRYEVATWVVVADADVVAYPIAAAKGESLPLNSERQEIIPPGGWPDREEPTESS